MAVYYLGPFVIDPTYLLTVLLGFIIAIFILVIGYLIGALVGRIIKKAIEKTQVHAWIEKTGRVNSLGGVQPSALIGSLAKWWIFSLSMLLAADYINLHEVSQFLNGVAIWIPQLLAGILIVLAGLIIADFVVEVISKAKKLKGVKIVSSIVRAFIIIAFVIEALDVIGIKITIAEYSWYIILSGVVLALSLAIGIGFGLAFKDKAGRILEGLEKRL
jgi:hypothetical protein